MHDYVRHYTELRLGELRSEAARARLANGHRRRPSLWSTVSEFVSRRLTGTPTSPDPAPCCA